jgi:hypothetical protein
LAASAPEANTRLVTSSTHLLTPQWPDCISATLHKVGAGCLDVDIVNGDLSFSVESSDLSSDHLRSTVLTMMRHQSYDIFIMGTPCTTSHMQDGPPGPAPLLSIEHIYGSPKGTLSPKDQEMVQTWQLLRCQVGTGLLGLPAFGHGVRTREPRAMARLTMNCLVQRNTRGGQPSVSSNRRLRPMYVRLRDMQADTVTVCSYRVVTLGSPMLQSSSTGVDVHGLARTHPYEMGGPSPPVRPPAGWEAGHSGSGRLSPRPQQGIREGRHRQGQAPAARSHSVLTHSCGRPRHLPPRAHQALRPGGPRR